METELKRNLEQLAQQLTKRNLMFATAESCTGGGVAAACTELPGSSAWFEGGVVSYSNALKRRLLNVSEDILLHHGAVSAETAQAMALGARQLLAADLTVAVTGIAGPDGGTTDKPVGTVWFAWAGQGAIEYRCCRFAGTRSEVRAQSVVTALEGALDYLTKYL